MAGEETTEKTAATEETKQEEEVKEVVTTETIEQQKTEEVTTEKTEETTEQKTEEKVPIGVQQRINRMYARLQKEREARTTEEQKNKVKDVINNDGEVTEEEEKPLTKDDVDRIIQERERNKEFKSVETEVLVRHPESINEDGTFKDFEDLSKKNVRAFQETAEKKGIPFTHVVKFSESYEVLKEIKVEIGEFEFVVSEMEEQENASGTEAGEKAKREISVYSIM